MPSPASIKFHGTLDASHEYGSLIGAGRILQHGWKTGQELPDSIFRVRVRVKENRSGSKTKRGEDMARTKYIGEQRTPRNKMAQYKIWVKNHSKQLLGK